MSMSMMLKKISVDSLLTLARLLSLPVTIGKFGCGRKILMMKMSIMCQIESVREMLLC
jgi:hypothetical protein